VLEQFTRWQSHGGGHVALVEALEATTPGQVLQVRAGRAPGGELPGLTRLEVTGRDQRVEAALVDGPALGHREGLPQVREVRERRHVLDPAAAEVVPKAVEVELPLQMVHPRRQQ
jgi:hypothetical protein